MKNGIIITIVIVLNSIYCIGQIENDNFNNFIKSFPLCSLPLSTEDYFTSKDIFANNSCNISYNDFKAYLNFDENWKYIMYSKGKQSYYNYVTGCRINLLNNRIGLLYFRSFFSDKELDERTELVLSIYDKGGRFISHFPIAGNYSDSLTFSCNIKSQEKIEINYIEYQSDSTKSYTKTYKIDNNGDILLIK